MRTLQLIALPAFAAAALVACEQTIEAPKQETQSSAPAPQSAPPAEKKDDPSFSLEVGGSDGKLKIESD